ncbi:MAG: 2-oxo-hepta-3-ene-1,7-dioic acid hydratase, partial [Pseudomonadota bacterium]
MTPDEHDQAAQALFEAERSGQQIGLLSRRFPSMDLDDCYAIQTRLVAHKLQSGRQVIGWKIGLTSRAMQAALGIDIPDS